MLTIKKGTLMSQDETIALYPKTSADNVLTAGGGTVENELANKAPTNHSHSLATQKNEGYMSSADKVKLDSLTDEHLIRNVTLTAASFVANTDSYASFFPFCSDYTVSGMTETCKADYETEPGSDGIIERGNTMAGKIRFYASAQPSADVVLNNIVWKELG
ncbi:MAG: hypothetical protein ACLTJG_19720 [[Clostridium] innocuum]